VTYNNFVSALTSLCLLGASLVGAPSAVAVPQSTLNTRITAQADFGGLTSPQRAAASPMVGAASIECESAEHSVTGATDLTATPPEYATIGAAVAAASSGDQICIGAGTWAEQVVISQALTLTGAGEEETIIQSPAALLPVCGTDLANYANTVALVDICGSVANVSISGLTIDGDWDGAGPLSGMPASGRSDFFGLVVHGGASASISHLTVTNIHQANSGSWSAQQGDAIWVAPASTLNASDIHVLRYQKSGVVAYGSDTALAHITLTDSLIEGDLLAGMNASIAMNGITIVRTNASLHGVTSRGNQCDYVSCSSSPEDSNAGGLLIYDWDVTDPVMNVSIIDSVFTENDIGVYTDVTNPTSSIAVDSNDISGNRWFGVQLDEGHADFSHNDVTNNGIAGVVAIAGAYGVSEVQSTFLQNLITGNGGVSPASGAIRLADHSGSDLSMSANLTFTNNAIVSNSGTTVANHSAAGVITGTGTWWGVGGKPLDVSGAFTTDLATLSDALALDASDESYGFIVSSAAIASSPDLPPLTIASSDRAAMPAPITLDFGAISGGGTVTAALSTQPAEGNISFGTNPSVVDIDFTGTFTGSVEICIGYDPSQYYAGSSILLFHYIGEAWVDVTSSVDVAKRRVCGSVSSFSPFAAGEELAVHTVTYDVNEGALAGGEDTSFTFGDVAISAPANPTRSGYVFGGWFLDDSTFLNTAFPLTPTADTSVHAKWTAASGGGGGASGTSAPTNLSTPFLTGYTSVGSSITASPGTWTTATSFAYQWYRCTAASSIAQAETPTNCILITSDVGSIYVIQAADVGTWIRVRVSAQFSSATTSLLSATTTAVGAKPASIKGRPPRVIGSAAVGQTLTAKRGQWNAVGAIYTYQWYRCTAVGLKSPRTVPTSCVAISGGTSKTYVVKRADRGSYLRVRVSATAPTGQGFRMSLSTGFVPR